MRLIVDQQLPPLLAEWLRRQGVDAVHVRDIGLKDRPDHLIWTEAARAKAIVVSQDSDFVNFARQDVGGRLIWLRVGNCSNPELIAIFERAWPMVVSGLEAGERVIEVRPV